MPFISDIIQHKRVSIVGLEKNTGKTECLNYIVRRLSALDISLAITSIGIDGERTDQVTQTAKPEIRLHEGVCFATSEKHYLQKKITAEIISISNDYTSTGRIVTARSKDKGSVILSGPTSHVALARWIQSIECLNIDVILIDGALSRMSSASPNISKAMILSTGASVSTSLQTLVQKTAFKVEMMQLPVTQSTQACVFQTLERGIWGIDNHEELVDLHINSTFTQLDAVCQYPQIYVTGGLSDQFLKHCGASPSHPIEIIVRDFTKLFISSATYQWFLKQGGHISVLQRNELIAICVNPTAPNGYQLNSDLLCKSLAEKINLPIYDIIKNDYTV